MAVTDVIVNLTAEVTPAPTPSTLQQSGALVSVGGTTLTAGTWSFCATDAALEALLSGSGNHAELANMGDTFFAQESAAGGAIGVYVLELGAQGGVATAQITALQTFITTNPNQFYAYLTPYAWDASASALNTMAANYSSPTGRTYFFATTTSGTLSAYLSTTKSVATFVAAPTASGSEFGAAAMFYAFLANMPSLATPAAPMAFRFGFGVTPWVVNGNQSTINTLLTAFANIYLPGSEGGISDACLFKGTFVDGNQMMFWYAVDWILINAKQDLAAAIIDGSNSNPPLYYNQNGINQLLAVLVDLGIDGTGFGLFLTATFSATPFSTYVAAHPSDYAAGIYNGFTGTITWQGGFLTITFNLDATQFAA